MRDSNAEEVLAEIGIMASQRANTHQRINFELETEEAPDYGFLRQDFSKVTKFSENALKLFLSMQKYSQYPSSLSFN